MVESIDDTHERSEGAGFAFNGPLQPIQSESVRFTRRFTPQEEIGLTRSDWTVGDVLLVSLAHLPPEITQLTAETETWHTVVAQLQDRYRPIQPILLSRLHFDRSPGLPAFSKELDKFLFQAFNAPHPTYLRYEWPEAKRRYAIEKREPLLLPYLEDVLAMSQDLQALGITPR